MSSSTTTTDHTTIRKWAEARGGKPAAVKDTVSEESVGILRIDFPGGAGEDSLQEIDWDEFFEQFDASNLEFLYQEKTEDGCDSRFCKFISAADDKSKK